MLKRPDPRTPRTPDGKPNLTAPVPRTPDGKPDLSGIWNAVDGRFLTNIGKQAGIENICENEKDVVHIFGKP